MVEKESAVMPIRPKAPVAAPAAVIATPRARVRPTAPQVFRPIATTNTLHEYEPGRMVSTSITYPPRFTPEGTQVQIVVKSGAGITFECVRLSDGLVLAADTTHEGLEKKLRGLATGCNG